MSKKNKIKLYHKIRSRYQKKRQTKKWKLKKKNALLNRNDKVIANKNYEAKSYIKHKAPLNMSFIDNTDEVLDYFNKAKKLFNKKEKIDFNIKEITKLSPDAITLMIAKLNDTKNFTKGGKYRGGAPKDEKLKKVFEESGFYNFVATSKQNKGLGKNLLHKEKGQEVRPEIAKSACIAGIRHSLKTSEPFEPLYEIIIECMQNTNNHASSNEEEEIKWWMFVYNDKETGISKYSFLDLGVGIFESITVKNYINKVAKKMGVLPNTHFVKDLLDGNILSRIEKDKEIRGKGIPQIVEHSKFKKFKEFKIITNNVKIDLKNKSHKKLKNNFSGTFYYWELQNIENGN